MPCVYSASGTVETDDRLTSISGASVVASRSALSTPLQIYSVAGDPPQICSHHSNHSSIVTSPATVDS